MKILKIITLFIAAGMIASCTKKEDLNTNIPGLGGDTWVPAALDNWIFDSLTHPYNIQVKYKWDQFELELNKTLVPPLESKVQPVMDALRQIWINTYNEVAGPVFFKKYSPKLIVGVGSPNYNPDGSITLGTAEGGRKVVLYDMNSYDPSNVDAVKEMVHIVEHEFGHILNYNTNYPPEFKLISVGDYSANWINVSIAEAHATGFITPYAESGPDDDFVETLSIMLSEGRTWFETMVNSQNEDAATKLRSKEQMVVNYYKSVYNIDFYALQTAVQKALDKVTGRDVLSDDLGYGKTFSSLAWAPPGVTGVSPDFAAIYNAAAANLADDAGVTLDSMKVIYTAANRIALQLFFGDGTNEYSAVFNYTVVTDANGIIKLTYLGTSGNGTLIKDDVQNLLDYFSQYHFMLQWSPDWDQGGVLALGALVPVEAPATYYLGVPGN